MQRNIVFVASPTKAGTSICISDGEWHQFEKYIRASSVGGLSQEVRQHLLEATNLYASSLRMDASVKSLKEVLERITDWSENTRELCAQIWAERKTAGGTSKEHSEDWTFDFEKIQKQVFCPAPTKIEQQFPLALLDRILNGSIAIAEVVRHKLRADAGASDDRNLWFLWAALVFSILQGANIPVRHPDRKKLLDGPVYLLARLQLKLPLQLHLRKLPVRKDLILADIPDSFRKGAVIAFKIRKGNPTDTLQRMLARWGRGDFRTGLGPLDNRILTRFNRLTSS